MKDILQKFILELIERKMSLNEDIENILYADLNKILNCDDVDKIENKRKEIKAIYDTIEYLENAVLKFM